MERWLTGNVVTGLMSFSFSPTSLMKFVDQLFPIPSLYPFSELKSLLCSWIPEMPPWLSWEPQLWPGWEPGYSLGSVLLCLHSCASLNVPFPSKRELMWVAGFQNCVLCLLFLLPLSPLPLLTILPLNLSSPFSLSTPDPVPHLPFSLFLSLSWA